jgi:hypothetical protein
MLPSVDNYLPGDTMSHPKSSKLHLMEKSTYIIDDGDKNIRGIRCVPKYE